MFKPSLKVCLTLTKYFLGLAFALSSWPEASNIDKYLDDTFFEIRNSLLAIAVVALCCTLLHRAKNHRTIGRAILEAIFSTRTIVKVVVRREHSGHFESRLKNLASKMFKVTAERAVQYTKMSVFLVFTWPPSSSSSKLAQNTFEFFSWIFIMISSVMTFFLFNSIRYDLDDHLAFTKFFCVGVACFQISFKMIICKFQRPRYKILHQMIEDYLVTATPREREVLEKYATRCSSFHVAINVCAHVANLAMCCGPLVLPQSLPVDVKYPFSVEHQPVLGLAYFHQFIVGVQCASNGSVDCQAAMFVWFASARLELLAEEFERVTSDRQFNDCIKKHQALLETAEEIVRATRFVILTTIVMTILSIITGGVQLVSDEPLTVKIQYFAIDFGFLGALFINAWPAENLINTCNAVGEGVYNCKWAERSPELRQKILIVMLRARKHSSISIAGILPELSLTYYASFLSKTYSFFTALRIIIDDGDD